MFIHAGPKPKAHKKAKADGAGGPPPKKAKAGGMSIALVGGNNLMTADVMRRMNALSSPPIATAKLTSSPSSGGL